ncbi:BQ2448_2159 [Microbotryum intermedium]|uniref:Ceramide glucosyltransferase n=1 Tax=Microbotryum intermedium TaxID=269621 RepID=A0A238F8P9_9BASI|nr:BQ2448_2159 [Microbotryum intermedium]
MIAFLLSSVFLVWYIVLWFLGLLGLYVAKTRYDGSSLLPHPGSITESAPSDTESTKMNTKSSSDPIHPSSTPLGVSILRPLRGLDTNLYANLESSFLQIYSAPFEIIFSVASEHDSSIMIVRSLQAKHPHVKSSLIIGEQIVGVNPKINNLISSYRAATYDILWVIDSNVLTSVHTLNNSVRQLRSRGLQGRDIGLVHHLPFAIYPDQNLGSRVEQVFLCSTHAKMYLAINYLSVASCVTGKSCLYRKSHLEKAAAKKQADPKKAFVLAEGEGGLAAFGKYLGEDNMIGEALWQELGLRHAMGGDIAGNAVGSMSLGSYLRRRVRWIRVRKYMVVASTLIEPLTECLLSSILASSALPYLFPSLSAFLILPLHIILWYTLDILIYNALLRSSPAASTRVASRRPVHDGPGVAWFKAWWIREALALPLWLFATLGNEVGWRDDGKVYCVKTDGSVDLVQEGEESKQWVEQGWAWVRSKWGEKRYAVLPSNDEENF